ncbi:MAG TPA: cobalamin-dependent protein [Pseudobacteroides sp.]|uniref:B12-binding domain-containing radical SAM protein n=1 Tax=Pseudobacteroides sp. TaxID=1968840 RepID=UPI002F95F669
MKDYEYTKLNTKANNIVLINLPSMTYKIDGMEKEFGYNPSFALISLGTWLELNGYHPILIDLCCEHLSKEEIFGILENENPIIVGLSVHTENIELALNMAKLIKLSFPSVKIVFGGAHPSLVPEDIITSEYVDFIIRKEGESSFLELAEAIVSNENTISFDKIPGILFKKSDTVIKNSLRPPITDLDLMPLPKREFFDINKYSFVVNIITGRGCPGNCVYCAAKSLSGAEYRELVLSSVEFR